MKEEVRKHESYGVISGSRTSCSPARALFGSSIKHSNLISITISRAENVRSLHEDRFHPLETIVRVELSSAQFAEFITSLNMGAGVPCTIARVVEGDFSVSVEDPPFESKIEDFKNEFKGKMEDLGDISTEGLEEIKDILLAKDRLTKKDRDQVFDFIQSMMQKIKSNIPFVMEQFNRQMTKTVSESRQEVEGMILHKMIEVGLAKTKEDVLEFPLEDNTLMISE